MLQKVNNSRVLMILRYHSLIVSPLLSNALVACCVGSTTVESPLFTTR